MSFPSSAELADLVPPASATAVLQTVPAGTALWRVHNDAFAPNAFNPVPRREPADGGGRFDSAGDYSTLYAGVDTVCAVAETLLRQPRPAAPYRVPFAMLRNRRLSKLELVADLDVVVLHGAALSRLGADSRLTSCGPGALLANYAVTRTWAVAIRRWAPAAAGLVWRARHDNDRRSYVFFGDRVPSGAIRAVPGASWPLDAPSRGLMLARSAALKHGAVLNLP